MNTHAEQLRWFCLLMLAILCLALAMPAEHAPSMRGARTELGHGHGKPCRTCHG